MDLRRPVVRRRMRLATLSSRQILPLQSPALSLAGLLLMALSVPSHPTTAAARLSASTERAMRLPWAREIVWAEEFDGPLSLSTTEHIGTWRANDIKEDASRGYKDHAGDSWNINPNEHPEHSPFTVNDGILTISVMRTPEAIGRDIRARGTLMAVPKWSGGMLITEYRRRTFSYGYYEVRARWPTPGKGMFPAIWLYIADGRGIADPKKSGAEIDILEILGQPRGRPWKSTAHLRDWLGKGDMVEIGTSDTDTAAWHTYGLDWQPEYLRVYLDRRLVGEVKGEKAAWFDTPMAIRLNFTADGKYLEKLGRLSDGGTPARMSMEVDYVRVHAARTERAATSGW